MIPAAAAVAFVLFLLWKMRPAALGPRKPLDPRIAEARARAASTTGRERALTLCEAGEISVLANRPTAAVGYFLRAARSDLASTEPIHGIARALSRRKRSLERVLWRHLSALDWGGEHLAATRAALEELISLYRKSGDRFRADALGKALLLLPSPPAGQSSK